MMTIKQKENKHVVEFQHLQIGDTFIIYNTIYPILCMKIHDVRPMYDIGVNGIVSTKMDNTVILGYVNDINDANNQTSKKGVDTVPETSGTRDSGRMLWLEDTYSCEKVDVDVEVKR